MVDLRTPKGTIDLNPEQAFTESKIIEKIKKIFEQHAGVPISTPMFELRNILTNKYGDDSKLIFNLEDQGGDICSLRYDLTVPFSRYLCMNRTQKIRKYQIGNVFRRDNPSFKTGRLREFIQADFDICGLNLPMVNDAEIIKMIYDILMSFEISSTLRIKINDRRILTGLLKKFEIPENIRGTICSTVDKGEKLTRKELEDEFRQKGLNDSQIVSVINFMEFKKSNDEIFEFLKSLNFDDEEFKTAISEMELLFNYLSIYNIPNAIFDLSLARGLDYYTGLIIEAVYDNKDIGSVAGGGRYDNLCQSLSDNSFTVPCVGFSIGVTRMFYLINCEKPSFDVFVGSAYDLLLEDRMKLLNSLWSIGLKCETFTGKRVNYNQQIEYAKKQNFNFAVFTGSNEIKNDVYIIVDLKTMAKTEIKRSELLNYFLNK